jgi:hypothetical protein
MFSALYIIKLTALLAGLFALQVAATDFDIDRGSVDLHSQTRHVPSLSRSKSPGETLAVLTGKASLMEKGIRQRSSSTTYTPLRPARRTGKS